MTSFTSGIFLMINLYVSTILWEPGAGCARPVKYEKVWLVGDKHRYCGRQYLLTLVLAC